MTQYVGETLEITHEATAADGVAVTSATAPGGVKVSVMSADFETTHVNEQSMTYSSTRELWTYTWDTSGLTPGVYQIRCTIFGLSSTTGTEFQTVRLHADPSA